MKTTSLQNADQPNENDHPAPNVGELLASPRRVLVKV